MRSSWIYKGHLELSFPSLITLSHCNSSKPDRTSSISPSSHLSMSYNFKPSIFFIGATGYLGSEFLLLLARDFPGLQVDALVRNPTPERNARLQEIYPGINLVEGTLEDDAVIQAEVQKVDVVINTASSDHWPSVKCELHYPFPTTKYADYPDFPNAISHSGRTE